MRFIPGARVVPRDSQLPDEGVGETVGESPLMGWSGRAPAPKADMLKRPGSAISDRWIPSPHI
jgi:hypothetical protein